MFPVRVVRDVAHVRRCGRDVCLRCKSVFGIRVLLVLRPVAPAGVPPVFRSFFFVFLIFSFFGKVFFFTFHFPTSFRCHALSSGSLGK